MGRGSPPPRWLLEDLDRACRLMEIDRQRIIRVEVRELIRYGGMTVFFWVRKTPYFKLIINEHLLVDREVVWAILLHELTHMKLRRSAHDGAFYATLFRYISPERYEELRERGEAIILQAIRARLRARRR
jgi:hypothetical protein